jgi:ABC-2 type transport system permease protein
MNAISAIFVKQSKDMFRNIGVLAMFVVFPLVALALEGLIESPDMPTGSLSAMMAGMFAGLGLMMSVATIISEDKDRNSLKFLVIAGVKPMSYLLGIGGVVFLASVATSGAFGLIGGIRGSDWMPFMSAMLSAAIASMFLGAIIGLVSKNSQATAGLTMPVGMALGLLPMAADMNETVARFADFIFTKQISVVINDPAIAIARPLAIIWANIAVLAIVFAIVYAKKAK